MPPPFHNAPGHSCGVCRPALPAERPERPAWRPKAPSLTVVIAAALIAVIAALAVGLYIGHQKWHHPRLKCIHDRGSEACWTVQPAMSATPAWPARYPTLCVRLASFRTDAGAGCPR